MPGVTSQSSTPRRRSVRIPPSASPSASPSPAPSRSLSSTPTGGASRARSRSSRGEARAAALLAVVVAALVAGAPSAREKTQLDRLVSAARVASLIGQGPPPFTLLRPDGRRVGLSDLTGHVVLLCFWMTGSPYTAQEMPGSLEKVQREPRQRRFTVVAVNIKDSKEDV